MDDWDTRNAEVHVSSLSRYFFLNFHILLVTNAILSIQKKNHLVFCTVIRLSYHFYVYGSVHR